MSTRPQAGPASPVYAHKWQVMTAVGLAVFLGTVDGSIVNIALPTISEDFGAGFSAVQWVVLSYLLVQATLVLGMGRLADMVGRKAIFVTGFALFIAASMLAGLSPSVEWLIAFRVLQGSAAAMIFSIQFALITDAFPPSERGKALGLNSTLVSTGIISGPIIGGFIIDAVDWRWIFYVNVPIGIVGIVAAVRYIPHVKPERGERFDYLGAGLFFVGLLALLLGLTWSQDRGFTDPVVLALYAVALVFLAAFGFVERHVAHPMVDPSLFSSGDFSVSLLTRFASFMTMGGIALLFPFYLTNVVGLTPRGVGLALAALPLMMGSSAPFAGIWSDRSGVGRVALVGLGLLGLSFIAGFAFVGDTGELWPFLLMSILLGLGFGIFQSPNNSTVMGAAPKDRLGVASSLVVLTRITGWITGIAVLGTIWAVRTSGYAGGGDAAEAAASAQAAGLNDVLGLNLIVIVAMFALSWWTWRGRMTNKQAAARAG